MRAKQVMLTIAGLSSVGICLAGARIVAHAQDGLGKPKAAVTAPGRDDAAKKPESADKPVGGVEVQGRDGAAKKPDTAEQRRLRAELDALLKQRADLDQKINDVRGKLGEGRTTHRWFEFQSGDGKPQVFEFDGATIPPEAHKQIEEAQKRMRDVLGNMDFGDFPKFDFQFDNGFGNGNGPDMKQFRERMQKWQQQFQDRMQRRFNNGQPGDKDPNATPTKPVPGKVKTLDI